ncbi:endonuclease domain-containing protein [Arcanobacterium canis]
MIPAVLRKYELIELGYQTQADIRHAITQGHLHKVARGWYTNSALPIPDVYFAALLTNTQVACCSALSQHNIWIPPRQTESIHLALTKSQRYTKITAARQRINSPIVAHRGASWDLHTGWERDKLLMPLEPALEQAIHLHDPLTGIIAVESALNQGAISYAWVDHLCARLPSVKSKALLGASHLSESGSETKIAHFLRSHRFQFRQQVRLFPGMRVDFLRNRHVIEVDGFEYHAGHHYYERDRERDLRLQEAGFTVTRLSFAQVWRDWERTAPRLLTVLRTLH